MMRGLLALTLLAACGGSSKPAATTPMPPPGAGLGSAAAPPAPGPAGPAPTVAQLCARVLDLRASGCKLFADIAYKDVDACVADLGNVADDPQYAPQAKCAMQPSCEEVTNCLAAAAPDDAGGGGGGGGDDKPGSTRACADTNSMDPVGIPKADWDKRNGAAATKFSKVVSTKAKPVEMCGISQENQWLVGLKCDDGSQPLHNPGDAETVRGGNVGPGGKCGSIIDVYKPTCGGTAYAIYIDAYVCPAK